MYEIDLATTCVCLEQIPFTYIGTICYAAWDSYRCFSTACNSKFQICILCFSWEMCVEYGHADVWLGHMDAYGCIWVHMGAFGGKTDVYRYIRMLTSACGLYHLSYIAH